MTQKKSLEKKKKMGKQISFLTTGSTKKAPSTRTRALLTTSKAADLFCLRTWPAPYKPPAWCTARAGSPAPCWPVPFPHGFGTGTATYGGAESLCDLPQGLYPKPTTGCKEGGRRASGLLEAPRLPCISHIGRASLWQQGYETVRQEVKPDQS